MNVRATIRDKKGNIIAQEMLTLSDQPMYGYSEPEIELMVSHYVNEWMKQHIDVVFDIIDNNSGKYPYIDWEKRD